jgi:hypothetical protein
MLPLTQLQIRGGSVRGRRFPAVGKMLHQEELAFIRVMSNVELSQVFLRELRNSVATGSKNDAIAASKANATNASALERQSGDGSEALTCREFPQLLVSQRKPEKLSSSDGPSGPASRHLVPGHLFGVTLRNSAELPSVRIPRPGWIQIGPFQPSFSSTFKCEEIWRKIFFFLNRLTVIDSNRRPRDCQDSVLFTRPRTRVVHASKNSSSIVRRFNRKRILTCIYFFVYTYSNQMLGKGREKKLLWDIEEKKCNVGMYDIRIWKQMGIQIMWLH